MGEIEIRVPFPLDLEGFFRRECPLCRRAFKVLLTDEEIYSLAQEGLDSFMIEQEKYRDPDEINPNPPEQYCPYCGQAASRDSWWTQEQLEYIKVFAKNIMADIINNKLIRPLQKTFGSQSSRLTSLNFNGNEMPKEEPWISPEVGDMEVFNLPCCGRKIKIEDGIMRQAYCFFCGFPHSREHQGSNTAL